jgi:hypothetical protein
LKQNKKTEEVLEVEEDDSEEVLEVDQEEEVEMVVHLEEEVEMVVLEVLDTSHKKKEKVIQLSLFLFL